MDTNEVREDIEDGKLIRTLVVNENGSRIHNHGCDRLEINAFDVVITGPFGIDGPRVSHD